MKSSKRTKLDEQAYKRDNCRCAKCGRKNGIEAHHIIPGIEKIDNLITLCHSCHKREHNFAGCFKKGFDSRRKISRKRQGDTNKGWEYLINYNKTRAKKVSNPAAEILI